MKKLRFFDSLKFVVAAIVCTFILNVAHADTNTISSVIAYGKTEQSGTPTPTTPVPIMTNNGVLKVNVSPSRNLFDINTMNTDEGWYVDVDETVKNARGSNRTIVVPCKPNTKYSVWHTEGAGGWRAFGIADNQTISENMPVVWRTNTNPTYKNKNVVSIITTGDTHRMFIIAGRRDAGISRSFNEQLSDFMVVEGELSTATAYEPYSGPNGIYADGMVETIRDSAGHTATAQMLLSVGDYKDEQSILDGVVTRKVGVKVLDGTENWGRVFVYGNVKDVVIAPLSSIAPDAKILKNSIRCSHFRTYDSGAFTGSTAGIDWASRYYSSTPSVGIQVPGITTSVAQFKSWLADQYNAGTPVIVVYPLETETTESVATQTLTTAPVRQTAGSILGMPIEVVLGDGTREWVRDMITIATTKYNEEQFEPVQNRLSDAVNAVEYVVSNTMTQAQAIDQIANEKQTRPDETCPVGKNCLLVEDENGTPHWYVIAGADEANPTNP